MEVFDPESLVIGGVALLPLIFGTTQFLKEMLEWEDKKAKLLAFFVSIVYASIFIAVPYLPEPAKTIVVSVVMVAASAFSAMGLYQFSTRND